MIEPVIRRESVVDGCARLLREAIVERELAPGEKLLPERELARQLGVNRVTIRSALERLAAGHLVEVRQGSGHRVRDFRRHGGPELIPFLLRREPSKAKVRDLCRDLLRIRRALLRVALERAAEDATRVERERVVEAVARLEDVDDPEAWAALERIVFDTILDASHSLVVTLCANPILSVLGQIPRLEAAARDEARGSLDAFRMIATGLSSRRGEWLDEALAELTRRDLMVLSHLKALS
jgi:DNA-binding FadR family transcriptional regulator